ncbi:MAG: response regulator [Acidobacteriota bacterium]
MSDVLIIEDEISLRESLLDGLAIAFPKFSFGAYGSVEEAMPEVEAAPPRLVISDVRLPGASGVDFLLTAKRRWPRMQFILITAFADIVTHAQANECGAYRLLRKPFALQDLVGTVRETLSAEVVRHVESVSILQLMQLANLAQQDLVIRVELAADSGQICLRGGEVVHAEAGPLVGLAALEEMLHWRKPRIEVRAAEAVSQATVREPFQEVVSRALRRVEVDTDLSPAIVESPSAAAVPVRSAEATRSLSGEQERRETAPDSKMPSTLAALTEIEGFLGWCVVEIDSGKTLDARISSSIDVVSAASQNLEVIRAKRQVLAEMGIQDRLEDILITLRSQYHLLRLLDSDPDSMLYLVLDRDRANLALARRQLDLAIRAGE